MVHRWVHAKTSHSRGGADERCVVEQKEPVSQYAEQVRWRGTGYRRGLMGHSGIGVGHRVRLLGLVQHDVSVALIDDLVA